MASETPATTETQEQSIKSRKRQLFETEPKAVDLTERIKVKSVEDYLRETPATPLSKNIKLALWGAGGLVGLVFLAVLMIGDRRPKARYAGGPAGPEPLPIAAAEKSSQPKSPESTASKEDYPDPGSSKAESSARKKDAGKAGTVAKKDSESSQPKPPEKIEWAVVADPSKQAPDMPAGQDVTIPIPAAGNDNGSNKVLFPTTPSPFVAVGDNLGDQDARDVWDLRSKRKTGVLRGVIRARPPFAMSPDGTYLAGRSVTFDKDKKDDKKPTVGVWSFKTGGEVKQIVLKSSTTDFIDFAGPDLLVTARRGSEVFEVWDFQKGESAGKFEAPGPVDHESLTLSPGRKYLAMAGSSLGSLWVFEVTAEGGKPAGEIALPKDLAPETKCVGMTFSPDGKELAALFDTAGKLRVLAWDAGTGKLVADHTLDQKSGIFRAPDDRGRALEWFPDRSGWLVYSQAIVDYKSGHRIWTLPLTPFEFPAGPRRLVDSERALMVWIPGRSKGPVVRSVALPKDKIAGVRQLVRNGGSAVDAVLPPVKAADLNSQRTVPAAAGSWSVAPDPATKPAKPLISRPIVLKGRIYEVEQVMCSGPETAQAIIATRTVDRNAAAGNILSAGLTYGLERYDLTNGKSLAQNDVPAVCELVAFSPDAGRLLLRDAENRERLDVYAAADMKFLAGWRPYDKETGADRAVVWTTFLDQHRALTVNPAGKLVLWALPDCRAIYTVKDAFQGVPVLSPGRKHVAGFAGGVIRFFDPATGQRQGEMTAPSADDGGKPGLMAGAFRNDVQQFAALLNGNQLVRFDLTGSGKVLSEFRSPAQAGTRLEWCGQRHVLVNNQALIDLDRQWEVWDYVAGVPSQGSPDGRHWAAVEPFPNSPAYLAGFTLPEKGVDKVVAIVADKKAPSLLRAGVPISMKLEATGPPTDPEGFRKAIFDHFADQLKAHDIPVEDGQLVTLVIKVDEIDTGEKPEMKLLIPALGDTEIGKKTIAVKKLDLEVSFVDPAGKATYEPRQTFTLRDLEPRLPASEKDPEKYFRNKLWDLVGSRLTSITLPPFLARSPEGPLARFPGFTNLGQSVK